ncbi:MULTISPECIES: hypothetical protein [unclassified Microcoleus]|uniref:hypothetical protein n=1 Tax=unclassified Microcoleus TaxID=2642155 RepID=UPI0025D4CF3B|nr:MULTISPECIES: hypothetical protein [unclassified Microcoleus]
MLVAAPKATNTGTAKSFRGGFRVSKAVCAIAFVCDWAMASAIVLIVNRTHPYHRQK